MQTNARLARSGQKGIVGIHHIVTTKTTDELMLINLRQNGDDDQKWKTYCVQHPELQCVSSDEPRFGVMMAHRTRAMIDTLNSIAQMDMLRLQSLDSRRTTSFEMVDNVWRKLIDGRTDM